MLQIGLIVICHGNGGWLTDWRKKGNEFVANFHPCQLLSNNIGQIAYLNAKAHGLSKIYFGGCFIRGMAFFFVIMLVSERTP